MIALANFTKEPAAPPTGMTIETARALNEACVRVYYFMAGVAKTISREDAEIVSGTPIVRLTVAGEMIRSLNDIKVPTVHPDWLSRVQRYARKIIAE